MLKLIAFGLTILIAKPVWSQANDAPRQEPVPALVGVDNSASPGGNGFEPSYPGDRMLTPPPVSGEAYPMAPMSMERANDLRAGFSFTSAYTDNVWAGSGGPARSDATYSIAPTAAIDVTTARLHWMATYAPGFTFYQRTDSRNEADHNAMFEFQARLSPHVTFSASDAFQKSSNVFGQTGLESAGVSGGTQVTSSSVIVPVADRLNNTGNVGLSYQFARNEMIGATGSFTNLYYPNPRQVPGLYDSSSQSVAAFYSWRMGQVHYAGVIYQYQRLIANPNRSVSETQSHAAMLFYTFMPGTRFSFSLFGGPEYSDTIQPNSPASGMPLPALRMWTPSAGASLNWQGRLTSFALSYNHTIAPGSGLIGAVRSDNGAASFSRQITRALSGSLIGGYAQNEYLGSSLLGYNGHSFFGTATIDRRLGQHLSVELGYTCLHQSYSAVTVPATPNTNREFISIHYEFARPLGR